MSTRREYTTEFKREAVRLAEERGNRSAVAHELGLHLSVLRRWTKEFKEHGESRTGGVRCSITVIAAVNSDSTGRRNSGCV